MKYKSIVKTDNRYKDTYTQVILPTQSLLSPFYSFSSPNPSSPLPSLFSISPAAFSSFVFLLTLSSVLSSSLLFSTQFYVTKFKIFIAIGYKISQDLEFGMITSVLEPVSILVYILPFLKLWPCT